MPLLIWEDLMKSLIGFAVAIFLAVAFASPPTPTHAAALNAMKGGDWASKGYNQKGYNQEARQKRMAKWKAMHQKKVN
jgi:hypothetical protein